MWLLITLESHRSNDFLSVFVQAQLKQMIRKGIPREYRSDIWKWIVKDTLKETYQPGMYAQLMKKHVRD